MEEQLQRKVDRAIKLLQSTCKDQQVELSYSGGKDSDVILELAKMAGINYRAIYKCTTIDPPGTIKHCLDNGVEIIRPKISFLQIIEKKGFPTRRARFCCECLKEYKVMDKAIQGIRCSESTKRAKYYKEPTMCRTYGSKKNYVDVILPILDFTDKDVEEFIKERGVKLHPLYYNEDGSLNVKKRLGCMGCPLKHDICTDHRSAVWITSITPHKDDKHNYTGDLDVWVNLAKDGTRSQRCSLLWRVEIDTIKKID